KGTPMGELMRQYWIPAVLTSELPAGDGPPMRVKLLGEELIAFRTTSGAVGLIQNACPHRGASMFFGRNEEEGLRCVYHGWKFDVTGACVDMPSEPAESNFKNKVRTRAYPVHERNGIIWAYMGPREEPPPLPDLEANMLDGQETVIYLYSVANNWMQGWEGEMDTVHAAFLHSGATRLEDTVPGTFAYYQAKQRDARFSVLDTEWGTSYGVRRPAEEDTYYWRIAHQLFPFYAMVPTGVLGLEIRFRAYVPLDDYNTMVWTINTSQPNRAQATVPRGSAAGGLAVRLNYLPNTTDWLGRWRLEANGTNDYLIDRELQKSGESYSGIRGIRQQDAAVTGSMGPIYQRHQEHLGTTDALIIRTRRRMIAAAKALRDEGIIPPGVDNPEIYRQRSGGVILPRSADWWEATEDLRRAFVERPELATMATLGNA
ncbi:MAG TPA: Rieske 2Fe-2S domain-containing protein, partial [Dehalococcoidia bacterium]|nr:Rieske 2Fe-2S domain-containing protein [Dehalococcoidia bacterium]